MRKTVPLDKTRHNRANFDCGVQELNNYLRLTAHQQSYKDNSRTFVLEDEDNICMIIGYYTLTMIRIDLSGLPKQLQKKHHNTEVAGLIARLAIDKRYMKKGIGEWMLIDCLYKLLEASKLVGFPIVIVDAKENAKSFYLKYGFRAFSDSPTKLFMTIKDIENSLSYKR
jgi:predicted GNAT family N-acyltransferase